jgi:GDP-mannose 6-dehydrogenase
MNISIFGLGYVGCVSLGCLAQNGNSVIGVDINTIKVDQINSGKATIVEKDIDIIISDQFKNGRVRATFDLKDAVLNSDISIICVGTPCSVKGHLNMDSIYKVVQDIAHALKSKKSFHIIATRSTVMPGTNDNLVEIIERISSKKRDIDFAVVSNPEFLREGTSVYDYFNPPFTLIGSNNLQAIEMMKELYKQVRSEVIVTEIKVAEIIKLVSNTFHALKIVFANEIGNICQALKIDSRRVMDLFVKDRQLNISSYYLKPGFAYGGSCLPKDLRSLQTIAHDLYLKVPIIENIDRSNENQLQRLIDLIVDKNKKKIGVLGITFKPGTDDLRNSPAVKLVEILFGKGFEIKIYDKNVNYTILTGKNKEYIDTHIPHISKLLVNNIDLLFTESDLIVVSHNEKEYREKLNAVFDKDIIDLTSLDDEFAQRENYYGINW